MVARPVDETKTIPMENSNPQLELVHFTTQSTDGDYYDCKKLSNVKAAFASNVTTDNKSIRVSSEILSNGQARVHLYPEEASTEGYLLIVGKK